MSRLGRSLRLPSSLGRRLILAFVAITTLTGIMGMAAYMVWDRLGQQVNLIVRESLPAIGSAYQLERASSRLLLLLAQLRDTRDPVQYKRLSLSVSTTLQDIQNAYLLGSKDDGEALSQQQAFEELSALVADHANYLKQQIAHAETLQQLQKRSNWLHQDLVDDVAPLLQEVEWHLTSMVTSSDDMSEFGNVIKEFSALQDLTFKENELQALVNEVIEQRYQQDLESAFLFIGYKIDEMDELTSRLAEYPSTVSYRQILLDIVTLVKPNGQLHRLLQADALTHQRLMALRPKLDDAVSRYHRQVSQTVSEANRSLHVLGNNSSQMVGTGKLVILVVLALAILLSIFVLVVLIGRRLIGRLDVLGQDLARVAAGKMDVPIQTSGRDEIGQLGENLRHFCQQLQQMERSNALNLINNTQACLITCYPDGTIESVNPSALTLFRQATISPDLPLWQVFPEEAGAVLASQFEPDQPLHRLGHSECTVATGPHDEPRFLHFNLRRFEQGRGYRFIITVTDVTRQELTARELSQLVEERTRELTENNRLLAEEVVQRQQAQRNLLQTQDELIQAAKMAVVGQAMTSLAHELNQPLSAMMTYLYTSRTALGAGEFQLLDKDLGKIEMLGQRMSRIINALRNFARKSPTEETRVRLDLGELADQALLLLETRAKRDGCALKNELPAGLWIEADPVLVEQVLVNLLVNGMDAIAGRDIREIRLLLLEQNGSQLKIGIADSGAGFGEAILPRLFTPFTTSKEVGLGLGLTICRSLLARCDAGILLGSDLGGGAMVILEFGEPPSARPQEGAESKAYLNEEKSVDVVTP
ncbi:ATP-binding protein [Aeromonas enteropelogenes]|uniref:ATP-binding protein n=1 Tax=Aeromonas enteropelogenes TaxID=29489 RepID=UPI003BA0C809